MTEQHATGGVDVAETFPLHLALRGRRVLAVGGGPVAARKVEALLRAQANVVVVAPTVCKALRMHVRAGDLRWLRRPYAAGDQAGCWLVFTATGDRRVDTAVQVEASAGQRFCVRADDSGAGTARSPAVVRRADLVIGVGTTIEPDGVANPRRVQAVRDAIGVALDASAASGLAAVGGILRPMPVEVLPRTDGNHS